jgi:hypothetical protein
VWVNCTLLQIHSFPVHILVSWIYLWHHGRAAVQAKRGHLSPESGAIVPACDQAREVLVILAAAYSFLAPMFTYMEIFNTVEEHKSSIGIVDAQNSWNQIVHAMDNAALSF